MKSEHSLMTYMNGLGRWVLRDESRV